MEELIHLALHAEDERVRSVCCVAVLDRAYGRPREMQEARSAEQRFAAMTREERLSYMESLVAPMRRYLAEREDENVNEAEMAEVEAGAGEVDGAHPRTDGIDLEEASPPSRRPSQHRLIIAESDCIGEGWRSATRQPGRKPGTRNAKAAPGAVPADH
jgi:hypothetical protein